LAGQRGVDASDAFLHGDHRVGDGQREVLVGVDAQLGGGVQQVAMGTQPLAHAVHHEPATGVGDVHTVRAVAFHQLRLPRELGGLSHMAHHQEAGDIHAQFAGRRDVLRGAVGLRAVGGDPNRADPEPVRALEFLDRADSGEQQGGQSGAGDHLGGGPDPLPVGVAARPVVQ
jgi:hypothetical protein